MTDGPPSTRPPGSRDTLGLRLALSFLAVALAAVALLAGLIVAFAATEISNLVRSQRDVLTSAIAAAAAATVAWRRGQRCTAAEERQRLADRVGAPPAPEAAARSSPCQCRRAVRADRTAGAPRTT